MTAENQPENQSASTPESSRPKMTGLLYWGLLAAAFLLGTAVIFRLTNAYLLPKDTLLAWVPNSAIAYLHLNLNQSGAESILEMPLSGCPDEAARFVLETEEGLTEAWLLAWTDSEGNPTQANDTDWSVDRLHKLDDKVWLLTESPLSIENMGQLVQESVSQGHVLANNGQLRQALSQARVLAPLQFWLNPDNYSETEISPEQTWLKGLPALVGASRTSGLDYAIIKPLELSPSQSAPNVPAETLSETPAYFQPSASLASYSGQGQAINWVPLLFGRINPWRLSAGLNPISLPTPSELHDGSVAISLATASGQPTPAVYVLLRQAQIDTVAQNISRYLDTVLPTRTVTVLPDRDQVTELVIKPGNNTFRETDREGTRVLWNRLADIKLHLTPVDDGVVLSDAAMDNLNTGDNLNLGRCNQTPGNRLLIKDKYLDSLWKLLGLPIKDDTNLRLFIEKDRNLWISCRVIPRTGDK